MMMCWPLARQQSLHAPQEDLKHSVDCAPATTNAIAQVNILDAGEQVASAIWNKDNVPREALKGFADLEGYPVSMEAQEKQQAIGKDVEFLCKILSELIKRKTL